MELYFDRRSQGELISTMEKVLISDHFQAILERGYHELISTQSIDLLRLLFDLAMSTNLMGPLKKFWAGYTRTQVSDILKVIDPLKSSSITIGIKKILDFKDLTDRVSKEAFGGHEEMKAA